MPTRTRRRPAAPELTRIPLAHIEPDPDQPRKIFRTEEATQLAASMRETGLIQPIVVRPLRRTNRFRIVAGERRYRAAVSIGWESIDAIVRDDLDDLDDPSDIVAAQVLENIGRQDMTPIEEARAYRALLDNGWTLDMIGTRLGLPQWQAGWRVDLLQLIPEIQTLVELRQLKPRIARYLVRLTADGQRRALRRLAHESMNDGQVAAMVDQLYADENGCEMFPELRPVSAQTRKVVRSYEEAMAAAAAALAQLDAVDDAELAGALAANLPGVMQKTAAVRSEADRLYRRLDKLGSAAKTAEAC